MGPGGQWKKEGRRRCWAALGELGRKGDWAAGGGGQLGLRTEREEGERFRFSFFFKTFSNFKFFSNSF
jgi:hypothetical protein